MIICLLIIIFGHIPRPSVINIVRGTCPSIEMLKGYIARESLGTPVLAFLVLKLCQKIPNISGIC